MKYKTIGSGLGRDSRNDINKNFEDIDFDIKSVIASSENNETIVAQALLDAVYAKTTADEAKTTADTVQEQFDQIVAEAGSNNPEVVQARGTYTNLNQRLDSTAQQLAETADAVNQLSVNVQDPKFGAVADWDGTTGTDNTAAFSAAVAACPPGGKVIFPTGKYKGDVVITKSTTLDFMGSTIVPKNTSSLYAVRGSGVASNIKYSLSLEAKRHDRSVSLTTAPSDISAGDLVVLRDDTVRFSDKLPHLNMEVHEVYSVVGSTVTFKDSVRLPKLISATSNLYKISPIKGIQIYNLNVESHIGSTMNGGVDLEMVQDVVVKNFTSNKISIVSLSCRTSYNVLVDGFKCSNAQMTGGGQGYGIQMGKGTNRFTLRNGHGDGMRHIQDNATAFDGLIENVVSVNNLSAAFGPTHNGFDADITYKDCRSYGGMSYAWSFNSQGVIDPYSLNFYGFHIQNCKVVLDEITTGQAVALYSTSPLQESSIDGLELTYMNGKNIPTISVAGIRIPPINNDIKINKLTVNGMKYAFVQDEVDGSKVQTDDSKRVSISNMTVSNCSLAFFTRFIHNLEIRGLTLNNINPGTAQVFYIYNSTGQQLKYLTIEGLHINNIDLTKLFYLPLSSLVNTNVLGSIKNIFPAGDSVNTPRTIADGATLTHNTMLTSKNGEDVSLTSVANVTMGAAPLSKGIVQGQLLRITNEGGFNITIPQGANMLNNGGGSVVLGAEKRAVSWVWSGSKWFQSY